MGRGSWAAPSPRPALARGHELTLFNRGETNPALFPEAERLRGDRDGGVGEQLGRGADDARHEPGGIDDRFPFSTLLD